MNMYFRIGLIVCVALVIMTEQALCDDKKKGVGLVSGEPTGISGKMWVSDNTAVDGAVAWSLVKDRRMHIHADWLVHNWTYLKDKYDVETGEIPLYYGIGGRIRFDDDVRIGARFVLGISYIFADAPFDIFLEIAPILDVAPETAVNINSAIGVRYWFKK